jgi:hypothetical protein
MEGSEIRVLCVDFSGEALLEFDPKENMKLVKSYAIRELDASVLNPPSSPGQHTVSPLVFNFVFSYICILPQGSRCLSFSSFL